MSTETGIVCGDHFERVKLNAKPYVTFRLDGASYINKKAASILNIAPGQLLAIYHNPDFTQMFLVNSPDRGATISKTGGLLKFSATPIIRKIFQAYNISSKKADFALETKLTALNDTTQGLVIIPEPFNAEITK